MKIKTYLGLLLLALIQLSYSGDKINDNGNDTKNINSNVIRFYSYWLDNSESSYNLYRDPSLPDSFRVIFQDVCDHVELSTVIGQYSDFNYTDEISEQDMGNDICEVIFDFYGDSFAAKCCTAASPTADSTNYLYVGETTEFDILINSNTAYCTWTTGEFGTEDKYDREHTMRHEVAHGIGLAHNNYSELMRSDANNDNNPQRYITDYDRYNYQAIYNPVEIIKPIKPMAGYYEVLLEHGNEVIFEATKPVILQTDSAELSYYLLNNDSTYNRLLENYIQYNPTEQKYIFNCVLDTSKVNNQAYNLRTIYSGFPIASLDSCEKYIERFPHDELKIRFSDLAFASIEENQSFNKNDDLHFKVKGITENAEVPITDIANIGSVEYLLEYDDAFETNVFDLVSTDSTSNFEYTVNLAPYELASDRYLVSAIVRDTENNIISEIDDMPIWIDNLGLDLSRKTPGSKADWYALESDHVFDAMCIDYDQPWMTTIELDKVDYYYKDEFGVYQLLGTSTTPSSPDPIIYTSPTWSSGTDDMVYIKGMAYYTPVGETLQYFITSETTVSIADRYCVIDTPDSTNNVIGFNDLITIAGRVISQDDMSSMRPERDIVDVALGLSVFSQDYIDNHQPSEDIFDWDNFDYGSIGGKEVEIENIGKLKILTEEQNNDDENDITTEIKPNEKESEFSVSWYNNYYRLLPGLHTATVWGEENYDYANSIIATEAEVDFLVPTWDLKFYNRDLWFDNPSFGFDASLNEQKEYDAGTDCSFIIWRPAYSATPATGDLTTFFSIKLQNTGAEVDNFSAITQPEVSKKVVWNTDGLPSGYYTVEATEIDSESGIEVVKEREMQILPLYENWENSGNWPVGWSGSDENYWEIRNWETVDSLFFKEYSLISIYKTDQAIKTVELTHSVVPVNEDWELYLDIPTGIYKSSGNTFPELIADCEILVDTGSGFETEYVINTELYSQFNWGTDPRYCTLNIPIKLGGGLNGGNVAIGIRINGKSEYFTIDPEPVDTQEIIFDEIRVRYSKEISTTSPENIQAAINGTYAYLTWEPVSLKKESKEGEIYRIYKNGVLIAETTEQTYLDLSNDEYQTYTYSITCYDEADENESVRRLCRTTITTTAQAEYPIPENFSVEVGTGTGYNCVTLNWDQPDSTVVGYNIYRNDVLLATTEEIIYLDNWLENGTYYYKVTALYENPEAESVPTSSIEVEISDNVLLPIIEDFENGDLVESGCSFYIGENTTGDNLMISPSGIVGILATSGGNYSYLNGLNSSWYYDRSGFRTPNHLDLTIYDEINIAFDFNLYHEKFDSDVSTSVTLYLGDNNLIKQMYDNEFGITRYYEDEDRLVGHSIERGINGDWQSVNYSYIPYISKTDCYFIIDARIYSVIPEDADQAYIFLDNISITGTISLVPPSNLTIIRNTSITTLDWDLVPGATQYIIYRSDNPEFGFQSIGSTANITFDDTEANLEHNAYFYRVVAESIQKIFPKNRNQTIIK